MQCPSALAFSPFTLSLAMLVACGGTDDGAIAGSGGSSAGAGGLGGESGGSGGEIRSDSGAGGTGGGIQLGDGGSGKTGCVKTDFLFVVDSSLSMQQEQQSLTAAFPKFIASIQGATKISDFHVMVVDTDAGTRCTATACATTPHSTCNQYACDNVYTGCDAKLGAGVVQPTGQGSSNQICPIDGGKRYMDQDQTDLSKTFTCAATLGLAGWAGERPMEAMVAALSPAMNQTGGCNEGFLRKDAVLVVTFIGDEPLKADSGSPKEWYDAVVAAKDGKPESVVVLALVPPGATSTKQAPWSGFIKLWGLRGLEGDVGAADYAPFFDGAIAIIDKTCNDFVPPPR